MPKYLILLPLALIIISSCKKDSNEGILNPTSSYTGGVSLNFNKSETPDNVRYIRAVIKNSSDSIWNILDIDNENVATITFSKVKIGNWQLKVDAFNSEMVLLYTGTSDVEVEENKTTEINLVLQPVSTGVGKIVISISWGTTKTEWIDFLNNPILKKPVEDTIGAGVQHPRIVFFKDKYLMVFKFNHPNGGLGTAYSLDGIQWTHGATSPVIKAGTSGAWDDKLIQTGALIVIDGKVYCYYVGNGYSDGRSKIGLVVSSDGVTWEKYPLPVLNNLPGIEESIGASDICKIGELYFLYYYSHKFINGYWDATIHLATSSDGVNWTRHPNNPILVADKQKEYHGVYYASVIADKGHYKMVYMNRNVNDFSKTAFFKGTSTDGIHWVKDSDTPFFTLEQTAHNWTGGSIEYPFLRKFGNEYRVYYCSFYDANKSQIGFVSKQNTLD